VRQDDPQSWRLDVAQGHVNLYVELVNKPRALTKREAEMMVELVEAWRDLEHRKHIALESARSEGLS
jgi:hypothetical protein